MSNDELGKIVHTREKKEHVIKEILEKGMNDKMRTFKMSGKRDLSGMGHGIDKCQRPKKFSLCCFFKS